MDCSPTAEDHSRLTVLVKQIGSRNPHAFNRIIERLNRQHGLQVGDSSQPRFIQAHFVPAVTNESIKFGEFQVHRRIVGIIGVACSAPSTSTESPPNREKSPNEKMVAIRRRSSVGAIVGIDDVRIFYENLKSDYSQTLVDSRCILIGYKQEDSTTRFAARELLHFSAMEDTDGLEEAIREFLRNIYFVHEQKRMDVSFEKVDPPPCPILPEEEKMRIGTENKASKTYKRKCIGRCRKQQADYTLLAGLPSQSLEHYQNAIELLKSANDYLWLAGALEGWACAAMSIVFEEINSNRPGMHRVSSMTPAQIREAAVGKGPHSLGVNHGHQRYRSDEDASRLSTSTSSDRDIERNGSGGRKTALSWIKPDRKDKLDPALILESFEQAIEHYSKFGFAAFLEYECMMKATDLFRFQGRLIDMEEFHRTHVGKFLDDSFTKFDHQFKAQICTNSAEMYRKVNFHRKCAFFSRLGVLFRLHVTDGEARTVSDYRAVYPVLYRTLHGYGINEAAARDTSSTSNQNGPIELQIKALHEVYTSATRAQLGDAAIRHLCHLLQAYYPYLETAMRTRLLSELSTLVSTRKHNLSVHLPLEELGLGPSSIVLPPIQLTRFPEINDPEVVCLSAHLAPRVVLSSDSAKSHFIYSHFEREAEERKRRHQAVQWVVGAHCLVNVKVSNCLPQELVVRELCILGEGVSFETVPLRLSLPPATVDKMQRPHQQIIQHNLIVVPRTPGQLIITGYSCSIFGLKNVCKLRSKKSLTVEILPELPLLLIQSPFPKAPVTAHPGDADSAEIIIYSGQTFLHSLTLINSSDKIGITDISVQISQPKVTAGPSLIKLTGELETPLQDDQLHTPKNPKTFSLEPLEKRQIEFSMFGVDPTTTTGDDKSQNSNESKVSEPRPPSPSPSVMSDVSTVTVIGDRIPYTGRLLSAHFVFDYTACLEGPKGEKYKRTAQMPIAVTIVPAVTVAAWSILPGDGPFTRYIVVDVSNATDSDADLVFSGSRAMSVPPKETCRVPLLCPCCTEVAGRAFYNAQQRDSKVMQRLEIERLRRSLEGHVSKHLDIRWTIPAKNLEGLVPVGALLSSIPLLKQLVLPAISLELTVNDTPYLSQDDLPVGIGELITVQVGVISSLDYEFHGEMVLECEQEILVRRKTIARPHNLVIVGNRRLPFAVPPKTKEDSVFTPQLVLVFRLLFRVEGVYKVRPVISAQQGDQLFADEIFSTPVSFNVNTKPH